MIAGYRGDNELAERMFTEALGIFESLGDRFGTARVRQGYGMLAVQAGDYQRGRTLLADSVATFAELGHENYALWCTRLLAWVHYELGEIAQAREIHEEVVARARAIGSRQLEADSLGALGGYAVIEGRLQEAAALLQESTQIFLEIGDPELAMNLCRFARALALAERPAAGIQLLACGEAVCEKIGRGLDSWLIRFNEETAELIRQHLDAADYARAREDGKKLTPETALELALAQLPGTSAQVPVPPAR
jgi:tetratricopeptide (TPR) repeat protein